MKDIDADWDGKGSLQDHREAALKDLQQSGFGADSEKAKARQQPTEPVEPAPVQPTLIEVDDETE